MNGFELAIGLFGITLLVFSVLGLLLIDPERTRRELNANTPLAGLPAASPA
mgnify:FL=1